MIYSPCPTANWRCLSLVLCGCRTRFLCRPPPPSLRGRWGCNVHQKYPNNVFFTKGFWMTISERIQLNSIHFYINYNNMMPNTTLLCSLLYVFRNMKPLLHSKTSCLPERHSTTVHGSLKKCESVQWTSSDINIFIIFNNQHDIVSHEITVCGLYPNFSHIISFVG